MLKFISLVLFIFLSILLVFSVYFLIRNDNVLYFRLNYVRNAYNYLRKTLYCCTNEEDLDEYYKLRDRVNNAIDRYSYDKMLYSFKPLKLEYWFTEEEIKYLK